MKSFHAVLLILLTALLPQNGRAESAWVLTPVNVIDVTSGEVKRDQAVRIRGKRIESIVPAGEVPASSDVVDGAGGWLIPGLAEMHAHVPSASQGVEQAEKVLTLFLANGITTIRGMLGEASHLKLREQLDAGEVKGPRLLTSGPSFNGNSVSSPEQAARRVREQAQAGYDFLKIHPGLSREEFVALAEAAHEADIPFAGHVSTQTGLETALAYGQDTIDHLDAYAQEMVPDGHELHGVAPQFFGINLAAAMDPSRADALARKTAAANVWQVPTQSLMETTVGFMTIDDLLSRPGMEMIGEEMRGNWIDAVRNIRNDMSTEDRQRYLRARHALLRAMNDAGVGMLLGSDAPQIMNVPGFSTHQELAYLVEAGLSPLDALRTGTLNVARFFGETDRGEVREGHIADLILLDADPLEDIAATTRIRGVIHAGEWMDRTTLDTMLDEIRGDPL